MSSIEDYEIQRCLGRGSFGVCYKAVERSSSRHVVIKMIAKKQIKEQNLQKNVRTEVQTHIRLKHPNIVELYNTFEDRSYVYLVMELCAKGEVYRYIKSNGKLNEESGRSFFKQLVHGMKYLHQHKIVHRDLKLSNLLLTADMHLKISDFGLVTMEPAAEKTMMCGTPNYISPEMVKGQPYGLETDLWSLGCILYTFLLGTPPFECSTVEATLEKIRRVQYVMPDSFSAEAKDLIHRLLQENPARRITLEQIQQHPFMTQDGPSSSRIVQHSNGLIEFTNMTSSSSASRRSWNAESTARSISLGSPIGSDGGRQHLRNSWTAGETKTDVSLRIPTERVESKSVSSSTEKSQKAQYRNETSIRTSSPSFGSRNSPQQIDSDERLQDSVNTSGLEPMSCQTAAGYIVSILPGGSGSTVEQNSGEGAPRVSLRVSGDGRTMRIESDGEERREMAVSRRCPQECRPLLMELSSAVSKVKASTVAVVYTTAHGKARLMREVYPGCVRTLEYRARGKLKAKLSAAVGDGAGNREHWVLQSFRGAIAGDTESEQSAFFRSQIVDQARASFQTCLRLEESAKSFPVVAAHKDCLTANQSPVGHSQGSSGARRDATPTRLPVTDESWLSERHTAPKQTPTRSPQIPKPAVRFEFRANPPVILSASHIEGIGWVCSVADGSLWAMLASGEQLILASPPALSGIHTDTAGRATKFDGVEGVPPHLVETLQILRARRPPS